MSVKGEKRYFTYVKGLNTEAGALTFPENSWSDGSNIIPQIDGSVKRRLAVDAEDGYVLSSAFSTPLTMLAAEEELNAFVLDEWTSAGGNGSVNITVMQAGSKLLFFNNVSSSQTSEFISSLTLTTVSGSTSVVGTSPVSCYSAHGKLLVVSKDTEPLLLTYEDGVITSETITLKIRDLYGVDDGLSVNEKPTTLSNEHRYNLYNQGWDATKVAAYFSSTSTYPSNAQVWTAGKDASDNFSATQLDKIDFGTSPAARGRYVLDLFDRNRTTVSSITGLTTEAEAFRPTAVSFWAGRAWYAGVRSSNISNWVLYSQVSDTSFNFGKCYQDADPTSEQVSDLVATDGGVIPIQEAGTIVRLFPHHNSLMVLADNGVWVVKGGVDSVFSASSYSVERISSVGCIAPRSVVETEQGIIYWGVNGIYLVKQTEVGGLAVDNLTSTTIQTLYNNILESNKPFCSGKYFQKDKIVYWLYNKDVENDAGINRFKFKDVLCLDTRLGAFYTEAIGELSTLSPYVFDILPTKTKSVSTTTFNVQDDSSNQVIDSSSNNVQSSLSTEAYAQSVLKFGVVWPTAPYSEVTLGEFSTASSSPVKFQDWYSKDSVGVGFSSYLLTGYDLGPQGFGATRNMGAVYVTTFMKRTETGVDDDGQAINPSSCMLSARWDWADSSVAGRWSTPYQIYKHKRVFLSNTSTTYDDGTPIIVTKSKVRGRGKAVQFYFLADEDMDMQLVGWQVPYVGNNVT